MSELISRRRVFGVAATLAGAVASVRMTEIARAQSAPPDASAPGKLSSKQDVQYREQPNGQQRCSTCSNFLAPSGCRVVEGTISPNGWCKLFQAKAQ